MDERQKRALGALASMVRQYLSEDPDRNALDSMAMSAGEEAIGVLAEYGYMEMVFDGRTFGRWTPAGHALLQWTYPMSMQSQKPFPKPPDGWRMS
jgi:hypothetical protein